MRVGTLHTIYRQVNLNLPKPGERVWCLYENRVRTGIIRKVLIAFEIEEIEEGEDDLGAYVEEIEIELREINFHLGEVTYHAREKHELKLIAQSKEQLFKVLEQTIKTQENDLG